jgi:hypothetical protein
MASQQRAGRASTAAASAGHSSGTGYEFRWHELTEAELIPESWAENGKRDDIPDERDPFYAFQAKTGLLLEYTVDKDGTLLSGPHREEPGLRVLYITADGKQAIVREFIANENGTRGFMPPTNFSSIIAPRDLQVVNEYTRPDEGRRAVAHLYDDRDS